MASSRPGHGWLGSSALAGTADNQVAGLRVDAQRDAMTLTGRENRMRWGPAFYGRRLRRQQLGRMWSTGSHPRASASRAIVRTGHLGTSRESQHRDDDQSFFYYAHKKLALVEYQGAQPPDRFAA
jgi:hypothetical protein